MPMAGLGGLETAVIVPRREKKQPCLRKRRVRRCWLAASPGDRGPLLGKQEARTSRTRRATRRPPARLPPILSSFCPSPAACLSISSSVGSSELEALAFSFGAKLLSLQGVTWRLLCPPRCAPSHRDWPPRSTPGCLASGRAGSTAGPARPSVATGPAEASAISHGHVWGCQLRGTPPPRVASALRPQGHREGWGGCGKGPEGPGGVLGSVVTMSLSPRPTCSLWFTCCSLAGQLHCRDVCTGECSHAHMCTCRHTHPHACSHLLVFAQAWTSGP